MLKERWLKSGRRMLPVVGALLVCASLSATFPVSAQDSEEHAGKSAADNESLEEIYGKIIYDGISNPEQYSLDNNNMTYSYDRDTRLHNRWIVQYKEGTDEHADVAGAVEELIDGLNLFEIGSLNILVRNFTYPEVSRVRRLEDGSDLFMSSRYMDEAEAVMMMRAFAFEWPVSSVKMDLSSGRDFALGLSRPAPVRINFSGFSNHGPYAGEGPAAGSDERRYDRFIVGYKAGVVDDGDPATIESFRDFFEQLGRIYIDDFGRDPPMDIAHRRRLATGADLFVIDRLLTEEEMFKFLTRIAYNSDYDDVGVAYLELDLTRQPAAVASDELRANQYALGTAAGGIGAERAWDRTTGEGVVVAVVDTGITPHHDLDAHVLPGYDFISSPLEARDYDGGRDPDPEDLGDYFYPGECADMPGQSRHSSWHGTATAGAIAAVAGNGLGVAGAAPGARIVPVRVLGRCGGLDSDIAEAVIWAAGGDVPGVPANPHPAEVINLGLGSRSQECPITYQVAIDTAVALGATVVVAAGNDGGDASGFAPANCRNVVVAAASDSAGARAGFSNRGAGVDVSAPGDAIAVLSDAGVDPRAQAGYGSKSGTSLAAAHVSATVALMQSAAAMPLTPARVESVLKATSRPLAGDCEDGCGAGIIDAEAAVDAAAAGEGG
ncbi:S8 family serine peptidase [Marilutibacter maris]|nr:S8 family peptidase [Lysobacter maris]